MEIVEPELVKIFPKIRRHEPKYLDSSARVALKKCPRLYFLQYVLQYKPKENPIYFLWGNAIHKFWEVWEMTYAQGGKSLSDCSAAAMKAALQVWGTQQDPMPEHRFGFMTKERLIHSCSVIAQAIEHEKRIGAIKVLFTELPFSIELPNGIVTTGRFDQIIDWNGRVWGRDIKTTSTELAYYKPYLRPSDQFCNYTVAESILIGKDVSKGEFIAGQVVNILFNAKHTKTTKKGPVLDTEVVSLSPEALKEWMDDVVYWESVRVQMRKKDMYPQNNGACRGCAYHGVCKQTTQNGQQLALERDFTFRLWDNAQNE